MAHIVLCQFQLLCKTFGKLFTMTQYCPNMYYIVQWRRVTPCFFLITKYQHNTFVPGSVQLVNIIILRCFLIDKKQAPQAPHGGGGGGGGEGSIMPGTSQISTINHGVTPFLPYKSNSCGPIFKKLIFLKNRDKNTSNKKITFPLPHRGSYGGSKMEKIHLLSSYTAQKVMIRFSKAWHF